MAKTYSERIQLHIANRRAEQALKKGTSMEYYVERHASGHVGNSMQWWKKGGSGYVCDIRNAQVWTEDQSATLCLEDRGVKYTRWRKDLIDGIVQHHVDFQDAHQLDLKTPEKP